MEVQDSRQSGCRDLTALSPGQSPLLLPLPPQGLGTQEMSVAPEGHHAGPGHAGGLLSQPIFLDISAARTLGCTWRNPRALPVLQLVLPSMLTWGSLSSPPLSDCQHPGSSLPSPPCPGSENLDLVRGKNSLPPPLFFEISCLGHRVVSRAPALNIFLAFLLYPHLRQQRLLSLWGKGP